MIEDRPPKPVYNPVLCSVSLAFECGCTTRPSRPFPAIEAVRVGLVRDCPKGHGPVRITRVTQRLERNA